MVQVNEMKKESTNWGFVSTNKFLNQYFCVEPAT